MELVRWMAGVPVLLLAVWIAALNWLVFWRSMVKRQPTPSWTPLVAGVLGALGLLLVPVPALHRWWFVPLIVDWGSLPGIADSVIWHLVRRR
jgi:hypothetical protein